MIAILVAMAFVGEAPPPLIYETPGWARRPSAVDIGRVYPRAALRQGVGGKAIIGCKVVANGTLSECAVVAEEPVGMGFGEATLALAPLFQMRPQANGRPVEGSRVRIPVIFTPPSR